MYKWKSKQHYFLKIHLQQSVTVCFLEHLKRLQSESFWSNIRMRGPTACSLLSVCFPWKKKFHLSGHAPKIQSHTTEFKMVVGCSFIIWKEKRIVFVSGAYFIFRFHRLLVIVRYTLVLHVWAKGQSRIVALTSKVLVDWKGWSGWHCHSIVHVCVCVFMWVIDRVISAYFS